MNKEYIERKALFGKDGLFAQRGCTGECAHCGLWSKEGCKVILEAPIADVTEVKHGQWIIPTKIGHRAFDIPHCSVCEGVPCGVDSNTKYCPNCGAKMDGGV